MKQIDYNNISFEQFLEILPLLQVSYFFDVTDPEIFLLLFPVQDDCKDHVIKHVVCGYWKNNEGDLIVRPLGVINSGHPAHSVGDGDECLHDCICLATGRFNGGNKVAFSTMQGCLSSNDLWHYMSCQIQAAGEKVLLKYFDGCKFFCSKIGEFNYVTIDSVGEKKNSNPFSTVEVVVSPPM